MLLHYAELATQIITSITVCLGAIYTICLAIPGDQPDKYIKAALDITTKISRKKK